MVKVALIVVAAPFVLWLAALLGWVLLLVIGALYHAVLLRLAFMVT